MDGLVAGGKAEHHSIQTELVRSLSKISDANTKRVGYSEQYIGYYHGANFPLLGQSAQLSVSALGSSIEVKLNNQLVLHVTDATYTSGRVGLRIYGDAVLPCDSTFANVVVTAVATDIKVTNFADGESINYDLPLLIGTAQGSNSISITIGNSTLNWFVRDGRWRAFVPLQVGANTILLTSPSGNRASLKLNYRVTSRIDWWWKSAINGDVLA